MNDGTFNEDIIEHTQGCDGSHKTVEAVCPRCNKNGDAVCPHCGSEYEQDCLVDDYGFRVSNPQELLSKVSDLARYIADRKNAKLWWQCFVVVTGQADGTSMTSIAKHWGIGKANVSRICVEICAKLGLPPSRAMRDDASKINFRLANRRNTKQ